MAEKVTLEGQVLGSDEDVPPTVRLVREDERGGALGRLGGVVFGVAAGIALSYFLQEPITRALDELTGAFGPDDFEPEP